MVELFHKIFKNVTFLCFHFENGLIWTIQITKTAGMAARRPLWSCLLSKSGTEDPGDKNGVPGKSRSCDVTDYCRVQVWETTCSTWELVGAG